MPGPSVSCDDFANPDAAQYLLDIDDSYAEDLDPDGDGIACNESDEDAGDEPGGDLDADEYLAAVDEHFNALLDSFQDFIEITEGDVNEDDREALYAIYETWAAAADVAAGIEPPAGYQDIHEAYLDVANGFTELYNRYSVWLETESGTAEDEEALAAFQEQIDILNDLAVTLDQMLTDAS